MRNFFFPFILFALAMNSCAENDPNLGGSSSETNSDNLVAINVYAGTTRGTDTTTSTIEGSYYVKLHIYEDNGDSDTYTFFYDEDSADWGQSDETTISWDNVDFPATFYSMHDGDPLTGLTFNGDKAVYTGYTVTGDSDGHRDLVYHASELTAMPTGGAVSVYHKHALSKLHFYAATGTTTVAIARVRLVDINGEGTLTIKPVLESDDSTEIEVSWENTASESEDYQYYFIDGDDPSEISATDGTPILINTEPKAPMMIIPQETTAVTYSSEEGFSGSYIEVIYYMTDSNGTPIVGYSSVSERLDGSEYIEADQGKTLYVMGAFPLGYEFEFNKEYDITLGLGVEGSSGGILLVDYYVDEDGDAVTLTKKGTDTDDDGDSDEDDGIVEEIPAIDVGDDILADSSSEIDIVISVNSWDDGGSIPVEYTEDDTEDDTEDEI